MIMSSDENVEFEIWDPKHTPSKLNRIRDETVLTFDSAQWASLLSAADGWSEQAIRGLNTALCTNRGAAKRLPSAVIHCQRAEAAIAAR
jgi:hypothetical protein